MRSLIIAVTTGLLVTSQAQLLPLFASKAQKEVAYPSSDRLQDQQQHQQPIMASQNSDTAAATSESNGLPITSNSASAYLSDLLGRSTARSPISIFAGLLREADTISSELEASATAKHPKLTVLAPRNSALQALPQKPWESEAEYAALGTEAAYAGAQGVKRAQGNQQRFVETHIVPVSPWRESDRRASLAGGPELWWERRADGKIVVQPGGVVVDRVEASGANGEVWVLDGVLKA